jgi:hypothetical protein
VYIEALNVATGRPNMISVFGIGIMRALYLGQILPKMRNMLKKFQKLELPNACVNQDYNTF